MAHMKTAFSLEESLFQQIEETAADLNVSRSHLLVMAVEEFLQKRKKQRIIESLNAAYADEPNEDELETMRRMLKNAQKVVDPW